MICEPCSNKYNYEIECIPAQAIANPTPFAIICPKCRTNYMEKTINVYTETLLNTGDPVEPSTNKPGWIKKFRLIAGSEDASRLEQISGFSAGKFKEGDLARIIPRDLPP